MSADWSHYLPPGERRRRDRRRRLQRWLTALRQRRSVIVACVAVYLCWCMALLVGQMWFAFSLALLPLLFLPPLGYLAWWLVWKEFNE